MPDQKGRSGHPASDFLSPSPAIVQTKVLEGLSSSGRRAQPVAFKALDIPNYSEEYFWTPMRLLATNAPNSTVPAASSFSIIDFSFHHFLHP
jgi:hypothetical protein